MPDNLVLRLDTSDDSHQWLVVDEDGRVVVGRRTGSLSEAAAAATGRRVFVLVPGSDVVTTTAELPAVSAARQRQMLPYSLEDQFADDISKLFFAAGTKLASGSILVSSVAREKLQAWLTKIRDAGLEPNAIYADTDGVPDTPATLNLVFEGDTAFGRLPDQAAMSIDGMTPGQIFKVFVPSGDEKPVQHAMLYMDSQTRAANEADIALISNELSSVDVKLLESDALEFFAAKLINSPGTNLLQGSFAPKSNWRAHLKPWRLAAMFAALAIGITLLGHGVEYFQLKSQDDALAAQIGDLCSAQFNTDNIRQCQAEIEARLLASGQSTDAAEGFLSTLATVAEFVPSTNRFESLSYRGSVMDLQMIAPGVQSLDEFSQQVNGTGRFSANVQSANPQSDGGVQARVQIVGAVQ